MSESIYADDRAYLKGIKELMSKTESELVARLDELHDQMRYIDNALSALSLFEHVSKTEVSDA